FEVRIPVSAGEHTLYGAFPEDYVNSERRDPKNPATPLERAIFVDYFEVRGPYNHNPAESSSYRRIFRCNHPGGSHTDLCARQILTPLIRRAYRRPPAQGEVDRLLALYGSARQQGESFEQGIQLALKALLVSPHFLFRVEKDPNPKDASAHPVSETELASRLSYFLWSSMPDDELLSLAEQGRLRQPDVFEGQVRRMLRDRRSRALVDNFAGQWLHLRNLKKATPDPGRFPSFNEALRAAMARETELFFEHVLREDRSVLEFLDARYSFLNARLAAHYGVEGVRGREFRRVALDNGQRGGIVTQASILTVSSYPTRTSPVLRGLWVLENILGNPPPPPPPGVPQLNENAASRTGTLRQQLEQHRANPGCAVCHTRMDAIGFGLENYDAVGAWRTHDGGFPVDASGSLPGGKFFQGPAELRAILMKERDAFCRTLVQRTLTYALGRGLERYDKGAVEHISSRLAAGGFRFSTLILEIVRSDPFQMRRAEGDRK
ncbi:MAG: DUF1592 domain-containing protein, partial [Acidobacteria bacterium]|nr:DUF1592 domain-containing protein [Acidobacteriota bacterium]